MFSYKLIKHIAVTLAAITAGIVITAFLIDGGNLLFSSLSKKVEFLHFKNSSANASESLSANEDKAQENNIPKDKIGYFTKDSDKSPKLSAEAYLVGDLDTGEIILEKNPDEIMPIASVSKLMTALVSEESLNLNEEAEVSATALKAYGPSGGLQQGEKIKISELLYPLLLESSNDIAEVLAEHIGRSEFLKKMNEKTYELGMKNTFYNDPSGLSSKNASTVADLFTLTQYIRKNKNQIFEITQESKETGKKTWFNNNKLIYQKNYLGGKSGFTDEAHKTGVALFNVPITIESEGRNIAVILLKSNDRFRDTMTLVNYVKNNIFYGEQSKALAFEPIQTNPDIKDWASVLFVGDIMLDRGVKNSVEKNFNGDYFELFRDIKQLASADIAFGNLEGPLSDQGEDLRNLYSFRMNPDTLPALKNAGFDALSIANNHIGDWGKNAFDDTLRRLNENEILPVGGGVNEMDAETPKILERNGVKIGFLGFTDVGPNYLEASENTSGILLANNPRLPEIIQNASRQVDTLVVSFHWGEEYQKPTARQRSLAHIAIDSGAKIVAGTHPHVAQETEEYEDGFIMYSLGNFVFDQYFSKDTMNGLMVEVDVNKEGIFKTKKKMVKLNSLFKPDEIVDL